jgi:membrane peptidoglycan carboxypeptidase
MWVVWKIFAGLLAATLLATWGVWVRGVKKRRDAENNTLDGKTLYETLEQQKLRTSLILWADWKTLATLGSWGGQYVALEHIKPEFLLTLIAQEDQRFREHDGFDWTAIFGILKYRLQTGERRWGSTIASQVFKIVENEENTEKIKSKRDKFWQRVDNNILEMVKAQKIINMNQDEMKWFLLEYYLNTTYFSPNGPGFQYAARYWFLKDQSELTIDEIAMILQAARNPSLYNPKSDNPKIVQNAEKGTDQTLKKLIDLIKDGSLHAAFTAKLWKNMPSVADVQHAKARRTLDKIKSWTSRVMEWSNQIPYASRQLIRDADGAVRAFMRATNNNLWLVDASGDTLSIAQWWGYEIKTTLRTTLQKSMTSLLATQGETLQKQRVAKGNAPEMFHFGALVVDNETGAVLADVGGHDFEESELNVRIAPGQMGSVVKPIVLWCALELWIITSLDSTYIDQQYPLSAVDYTWLDKDREWADNYGEQRSQQAIILWEAAEIKSLNSSMMYVCHAAAQQWKAQAFMDLLMMKFAMLGITIPDWLQNNPMLTIGLADASLDAVGKMYMMLARGWNTLQNFYSIETIKWPQWMLAYNRAEEATETPVQLFHPEIVWQLTKYLLQKGKNTVWQTNVLIKSWTAEDAQQLWLVMVTEKTTTILRVWWGKPSENRWNGISATTLLKEPMKQVLELQRKEWLYDPQKTLHISMSEPDVLELKQLPKTDSLQVQEPVEIERE